LLEITRAINQNLPVDQLIKIYSYVLKEQLGFPRFVLFLKQDNWQILTKSGIKGKVKEIDVEHDLFRFKESTEIVSSHSNLLQEFEAVIPVFHKGTQLAFLLYTSNAKSQYKLNDEHSNANFIQILTNIIVVAIENQRMTRLSIVQERIKKELEVASVMQKLLFPADLPSNRRMDISAKYKPRHEVGGDYYDFIPLGDDEYIICIGDVSGKGIGAAMLMANFQATIRTLFNYQRFEMEFLMEELNKKVMRNAKGEKFITFFIAHYNATTRELIYVNAGHNHPFISTGKETTFLSEGCIGLGMLDELPFIDIGKQILKPNTTLVLFTDGVVELENHEKEQFSVERLARTVNAFYPLKMEDLNNLIFSKFNNKPHSR
jgi:sigma-B regulation protein RsbU (phosphoserine phosphatase)